MSPRGLLQQRGCSIRNVPFKMGWLTFFRRSEPEKRYRFRLELDREEEGRYIAEVLDLPGAPVYGKTEPEAIRRAAALAYRVIADRVEAGEESSHSDARFSFKHA